MTINANFSSRLALEGETIVVTGAAQGVGRAIAEMALDLGTTEEVASPVCFLLSEAASCITGQHIWVNGGYTIGS